MSQRQIILDTETTGIRFEDGHRLIEIGCVEMINRKLTGQYFHCYVNPERDIDAGAVAIHGITRDFLLDKPLFLKIAKDFIDFVDGAELIIHNAPFDVGFLNNELTLTQQKYRNLEQYCKIIDTLPMARRMHAGQRNSLDALCKRYGIDNSKRDLHGALLDANLLAQVYLAMTGGQGSFFDALGGNQNTDRQEANKQIDNSKVYNIAVYKVSNEEAAAHEEYLSMLKKGGKCLWQED